MRGWFGTRGAAVRSATAFNRTRDDTFFDSDAVTGTTTSTYEGGVDMLVRDVAHVHDGRVPGRRRVALLFHGLDDEMRERVLCREEREGEGEWKGGSVGLSEGAGGEGATG
ncbi:hypothetical protein F5X96DRAFT_674770 [Biscogniauxia mediterranea]|nr:hypothetical protein F5X96DRAFT_674770 [Biscogniauxia mediterranea]